ncbi:phosphatidate cytidylyltransferase [Aerococcus sp. UMB7834]|uniref:phosphatidate cytidylyltransferase n=1 Tax=Aerococcus sp. UMB7834 TaxID=3046342 RepID=UPI00254DFA0D|nr:phosphatidate cytidylyltransferase [Aerococcus sp. UMB7834]MDK6805335.1 phosphatidate cytidylyltransferase [Aerococcus sp. UMB7834]
MRLRTLTALVALAIFIPLLVMGGSAFELLVIAIAGITLFELLSLLAVNFFTVESLFAYVLMYLALLPQHYLDFLPEQLDQMTLFYTGVVIFLSLMVHRPERLDFSLIAKITLAALYVGRGYHFLILGREMGLLAILFVLVIIWSNDTFAYLTGRAIGRRPLAPAISPNKTIEGSIGGIVGAFLVSLIFDYFFNIYQLSFLGNLILVILLCLAGQMGDLVESSIKRQYHVKDSGKLLPGHGGFLDRFDNILFVLPIFYFLMAFF